MLKYTPTNALKEFSRDQLIKEIEKLRASQIGLTRIIESSVDAIITIDKERSIVRINTSAADLFNYPKDTLLHKAIDILIPETAFLQSVFSRTNTGSEADTKSKRVESITGLTADGRLLNLNIDVNEYSIKGKKYLNLVIHNADKYLELESKFRNEEAIFRDVFESMIDVFVRVSNAGVIEMVSPSVKSIFGYDVEEVVGKKIVDLFVNPAESLELLNNVQKNGFCNNFHLEVYHKSGAVVFASINAKIYTDKDGNPLGVESISRDITDRKKAKDKLLATAYLLEESQKIASIGYCNRNLLTDELEWSNELYRIYGVSEDEQPNLELVLALIHPEDRDHYVENISLSIKQIKDYNTTYRIVRWDNKEVVWVLARGKLIFDKKGIPISLLSTVLDITNKKQDEAALLQSEEEFRSIYENSYSGVPIIDLEGKFVRVNRRFIEMLGYSREELRKMTIEQITHRDDVARTRIELKKLISGRKKHLELEIRFITRSGDELICHTAAVAPTGIDQKPMFLTASLTDITALKKAQEILKAISEIQTTFINEENVTESFHKMLELVLRITNSDYGFIGEVLRGTRNKPFLKAHAITDTSWDSQTIEFCKRHAPNGLKFKKLKSLFDQVIESGKYVIANTSLKHRDKDDPHLEQEYPDSLLAVPFFFGEEMIGMIGVSTQSRNYHHEDVDVLGPFLSTCSTLINAYKNIIQKNKARKISEKLKEKFTNELEQKVAKRTEDLERTQEQLFQSLSKEKKLGELKSRFVAIASHQFRTPLTVIQSSMGVLSIQKNLMSQELLPIFEMTYARIKKEISRMTTLMDDALVLSKINAGSVKPEFKPTDIVMLCQDVRENYNSIQDDFRKLELVITGEPYQLELDAALMSHAISNLVCNAFKYSRECEAPILGIDFRENSVLLSVIDKGIGTPPGEVEYFFEPFYRASNVREISGTGLGTSICKEYVELNNGTIRVKSELNKGTEVIIELNKQGYGTSINS